eukprot:1438195-Pleurochrysis_carterae.AAC.3
MLLYVRALCIVLTQAITFSIFGQLPFIQSICAQTGRATSREAQTAFTLAFIACKVLAAAVAAIYLRIETRSLLSSFSDSIEAAQASAANCALLS